MVLYKSLFYITYRTFYMNNALLDTITALRFLGKYVGVCVLVILFSSKHVNLDFQMNQMDDFEMRMSHENTFGLQRMDSGPQSMAGGMVPSPMAPSPMGTRSGFSTGGRQMASGHGMRKDSSHS